MYTEYLADTNAIGVHELHILLLLTIFLSSGGKTDFECEQSK